jgi:predicted transcriptional regulator/DNA-binding XRE family transcriptional regulator
MKGQHTNMGQRLRDLRVERGLQQSEVARRLEISPAYLSLIEKGKRSVQLPLLFKAIELYGVAMEDFMASLGESRVDHGLEKLLDEPLLRSLNLSEEDIASLGAEPKIVTTITALFNLYKSTRSQLDNLMSSIASRERGDAEPVGEGLRFELSPFDEVTDFLEKNDNWFPALEERADKLRRDYRFGLRATSDQLVATLRDELGVDVRLVTGDDGSSVVRRWDPAASVLTLSNEMGEQRLKFQLAHTVGLRLLDEEKLHEGLAASFPARLAETRRLIKIHLANYFAGALLLPYEDFYEAVRRARYDIERLTTVFDSSYETVAHRVCNLSDPRRRGLPFYFLRVDVAGNISKRYSALDLKFRHVSGSCPKSAVHTAFLTPTVLVRRYETHPDGTSYFVFAKVVIEPKHGSLERGTVYSIGLGTYADRARELAYADEMPFVDPKKMALPVGVSCRFCERTDCNQRAAPSYKFAFRVDEYTKKDNFFSPLVSGDEEAEVSVAARRPRGAGSGEDGVEG